MEPKHGIVISNILDPMWEWNHMRTKLFEILARLCDSIVFFFLQDGRGEKRDGDNSADSG
jgi:hypothetical protein